MEKTTLFSGRGPAVLAFLACSALANLAEASVSIGSSQNVQIGGFFGQGWLYSSNNNYPTADKGGTWDFREMAVNVSTTFGSHLRVGGQGFAQRLGALGADQVILDWAVADYNFNPALGLRVGRVKYPKGLYGEALDLDVVRPFVFLPGAVYNPVMRDFNASFDGAMLYGSINAGKSSFDYKVFYGDIPMTPQKGVAEFYNDTGFYDSAGVGHLDMDSVVGGQLAWNTPISGLRAMYSYSQYSNLSSDGPFSAVPSFSLVSNIEKFTWNTLSLEYSVNNWVFAGEWQRTDGVFSYSAPPFVPVSTESVGWDGWYVSAARRLNDRIELGAYYGNLKTRFGSSSQKDYAVSVRYDVNEHILFKVEWHNIDGTYQTFNTVRIPNPVSTRRNSTSVLAVKTTLSF